MKKYFIPLLLAIVACTGPVEGIQTDIERIDAPTGRGNAGEVLLKASLSSGRACRLTGVTLALAAETGDVTSLSLVHGGTVEGRVETDGSECEVHIPCNFRISSVDSLEIRADIGADAVEGHVVSADVKSLEFVNGTVCPEPPCSGGRTVFPCCRVLYRPGEGGSRFWRIPAIIQLSGGTLLAVNDKRNLSEEDLPGEIDVVYKYSTDRGRTWSEMGYIARNGGYMCGFGDPGLAELEDGTVICTFTGGERFTRSRWDNPQRSYYSLSHDQGRTWSEPEEITDVIWGPSPSNPYCARYHSSFTTSGNSLVLRKGSHRGRILAANVMSYGGWTELASHALFSDDGGKTWNVSGLACDPGNEAKMVELGEDRILMSVRSSGKRKWALSEDGGDTWPENGEWDDVTPCDCNGDMIRYDENTIIHSVPVGNGRHDVSVLVSFDDGRTWPVRRLICPGPSQYSSLTVLDDGTVGIYFEKNATGLELWYVNFSGDWMLSGD